MTSDALNYPPGCTSDDVDNAWGTQAPIDERDPDDYKEDEDESDVQS
jgi:hypothetical protein